MAKVEDNSNNDERWRWDYEKEQLTPAILAKIVKNLASYAYDATCHELRDSGISDSLYGDFQVYCHVVKDHFEQVAKDAPASAKGKLSQIAEEAFELVDLLVEWVKKTIRRNDSGINARYMPIDDPCSHTELASKWDTIVRKFNLCMSSQGVKKGQDESPLEENLEEQGTAGGQQTGRIELPLKQRFAFSPGQVLFDGKDIGVKTGLAQDVLKKLVEHFGLVVKFKELDESVETSDKEASVQLRDAISHLNKRLKDLPIEIENRRGSGYFMSARD